MSFVRECHRSKSIWYTVDLQACTARCTPVSFGHRWILRNDSPPVPPSCGFREDVSRPRILFSILAKVAAPRRATAPSVLRATEPLHSAGPRFMEPVGRTFFSYPIYERGTYPRVTSRSRPIIRSAGRESVSFACDRPPFTVDSSSSLFPGRESPLRLPSRNIAVSSRQASLFADWWPSATW